MVLADSRCSSCRNEQFRRLKRRITEAGQIKDNTGATTVNDQLTRSQGTFDTWMGARSSYKGQITTTVYDEPYGGFTGIDSRLIVQQQNLRNRVSFSHFSDTANGTSFNQATFYSYDIHGNVDTLVQDYGVTEQFPNLMNTNGNRFKKIIYNYDLISGKVNKVAYQPGWSDQVFHQYAYDAENRLTDVETSFDNRHWDKDARYEYYRHGPLARTALGDQQVQGIDYAYTLQGWLKGVNSSLLLTNIDMGEDGLSGGIHQFTARDAIGFNLNYYDTSDYSAIGGSNPFPGTMAYLPSAQYRPLFNGNISSMVVHNRALKTADAVNSPMMLYTYHYDQLNRITQMDAYKKADLTTNNWAGLTGMNQYKEFIAYDANGNILQYKRHGQKTNYIMDSLTYTYTNNTNRLNWVKDVTPSTRYGDDVGDVADMDNQAVNNYAYDEIGNMVKDVKEGIINIKWSVYGKILEINRTATATNPVQKITYTYDAQGNRISKTVLKNTGNKMYTWYVRDAQGNVMSAYSSQGNPTDLSNLPLTRSEVDLYGSGRLGIYTKSVNVDLGPKDMTDSNSVKYYRGFRQYELSNHLGNVLATISDKKKPVDTNGDGQVDYYDADVTTAQDYYPFGMLMPGRIGYQSSTGWLSQPGEAAPDNGLASDVSIDSRTSNQPPEYTATNSVEMTAGFTSGTGDVFLAYISPATAAADPESSGSSLNGGYRYGFNGKENDNEVKGTGNQQDYGARIYDDRLGRFLSVDPLTQKFPFYTPFQFAGNKPIWALDIDGQEDVYYTVNVVTNGLGQTKLRSISEDETKAVHFWNSNQTGKLGHGTLFTYRIQAQDMDGKPISLITKEVFVPKATFAEKFDNILKGNESASEKIGYVIFGNGKDMQWQSGLPRALSGSETIDMGDWLDLASGLRDDLGVRDLAEDFSKNQTFIKTIQKITQIDDALPKNENKEKKVSGNNFVFKRDDSHGSEKKGSIQEHAYVTDTVISRKESKDTNGVDTFYIKQKNK